MSVPSIQSTDRDGERPELLVHDPATGALLGSVERVAPEEVDRVVGEVAKVVPLWALLRVQDRGRYMRRMAQAVIDEFDELVELIAREQGRPRAEIASLELLAAVDALIWMADEGARLLGGGPIGVSRLVFPLKRARIAYEPYGVIGVIGAGSAPFAQPLGQIAGALMAGNGVAFKPAARASLAGERIARLVARAGLPEGIVRILHGGADAGVALAQSPVEKILFTGSPPVGRVVARACVSREKEVALELGGKDAMLVLADAHLPRAIAGALWAGCAGAGAARGSIERVYVARELYDRFLTGLVRAAEAIKVGNPSDPLVQVGPLASARRAERLEELVQEAIAQGARRHCGGPVSPPGCDGRRLLRPVGDQRRAPGDADHARAARRPGAAGDGGGQHRPGDRAGQRQRVRPRRLDLDLRPLHGVPHRPRAAGRDGVAQRPPPGPDGRPRPVGSGRRRWDRAHARPRRAAGLRPGEAHHLGPPAPARESGGAPTTAPARPPRGPWRGSTPAARASAGERWPKAAWHWPGSAPAPSGVACRAEAAGYGPCRRHGA